MYKKLYIRCTKNTFFLGGGVSPHLRAKAGRRANARTLPCFCGLRAYVASALLVQLAYCASVPKQAE